MSRENLYPQPPNYSDEPDISVIGEAFDTYTVLLMRHAADELNLTLPYQKYEVIWEDRVCYDREGKRLHDGMQWVRVCITPHGQDFIDFWARVDELRNQTI